MDEMKKNLDEEVDESSKGDKLLKMRVDEEQLHKKQKMEENAEEETTDEETIEDNERSLLSNLQQDLLGRVSSWKETMELKSDQEQRTLLKLPMDLVSSIRYWLHPREKKTLLPCINDFPSNTPSPSQTQVSKDPWLMTLARMPPGSANFFSFVYEDPFSSKHSLKGAKICCANYGWVLLVQMGDLWFYRPFTSERVTLPSIGIIQEDKVVIEKFAIEGFAFTYEPVDVRCTVVALRGLLHNDLIVYVIRKGEGEWRRKVIKYNQFIPNSLFLPSFGCMTFVGDVVYCLGASGNVASYDPNEDKWNVLRVNCLRMDSVKWSYMLESEGRPMVVLITGPGSSKISIYWLDIRGLKWNDVKNIGEMTLFLSHASCVSLRSQLPELANHLCIDKFYSGCLVAYSLAESKFKTYTSGLCSNSLTDFKESNNCCWILPATDTHDELTWYL